MCCNKILIKIFIKEAQKVTLAKGEFAFNSIKRNVAIDFSLADNKLIHIVEKNGVKNRGKHSALRIHRAPEKGEFSANFSSFQTLLCTVVEGSGGREIIGKFSFQGASS